MTAIHRHKRATTAEECPPHGLAPSDRRSVEANPPSSASSAPFAEGRKASGRQPAVFRGDLVDSLDGGTVEHVAEGVWDSIYLLSETPAVGGRWHLTESLASVSGPVERPTTGTLGRVLCGRELCSRKKGGPKVGKTKRGKGTKWMVLADGRGTPLGVYLDSASPAEVRLLESTLCTVAVPTKGRPRRYPERLIADRGYDSNGARRWLKRRGIQPIIPSRENNPRATDQDGRHLRRYRHRWIIERTIEWIGSFRRLVVRYERLIQNYAGLLHMACALLTLRRVLG